MTRCADPWCRFPYSPIRKICQTEKPATANIRARGPRWLSEKIQCSVLKNQVMRASRSMIHSTAGSGTNRQFRNGPAITLR